MKTRLTAVLLLMMLYNHCTAQEKITLQWCYEQAKQAQPMIRQHELLEKMREYSVDNIAKGIFPSIIVNAQQSYQSDVTGLPVEMPGIEELSKNQYKIYADITLPLYDGGDLRHRKRMQNANTKIDRQKIEVELYQVREKVNQVYFGILLLDGKLEQNRLLNDDLESGLKAIKASIEFGTALRTSADILQAELLRNRQARIEIAATRDAYIDALNHLVGGTLNESVILEMPEAIPNKYDVNRPEIELYEAQHESLNVVEEGLKIKARPKVYSFLQGGYGRPGLNMLDNNADTYYIAGIRLNWNISSFYTHKKERSIVELSRKNIDVQRESFVFNTNYAVRQKQGELNKYEQLLATDEELIQLRMKIKATAAAQLEHGVVNTNDYVKEVIAEDQARQNKVIHQVQYLMAQYAINNTTGN
jgi:outer membrane protein TolC